MSSNSPETLQLVASQLEAALDKYLGPHTYYVLVLAQNLSADTKCNAISNIPLDRSDQLKDVFAELSSRHVHAHN